MADEDVKVVIIQQSQNIGKEITYEIWEQHWINTKLFKSTAFRENQFKMFNRWHLPPATLAKMYNMDNKCWKCKEVGTCMVDV